MQDRAEPKVSGVMFLQHRTLARKLLGENVLRAALGDLPADVRDEIGAATPLGWVRIRSLETFYAVLANRSGRDIAELHTEIARASVERTLKTVWRVLVRFTGDAALVTRAPLLYSRTYSHGRLVAQIVSPGHAELVLSAWPAAPELALRGLAVGIETVLRVAGRDGVRVTRQSRPDGAILFASWRA